MRIPLPSSSSTRFAVNYISYRSGLQNYNLHRAPIGPVRSIGLLAHHKHLKILAQETEGFFQLTYSGMLYFDVLSAIDMTLQCGSCMSRLIWIPVISCGLTGTCIKEPGIIETGANLGREMETVLEEMLCGI